MALRNWPARKLGRAWLLGLILQAVVLAVLFVLGRLLPSQEESPAFRELRTHMDSVDRGLLPPPRELTPEQKGEVVALLRDSFGITVGRSGDTIRIGGPPAFDSAVVAVGRGVGQVMRAATVMLAAIFLAIPTALMILTLAWLLARKPWRPDPASADA